MPRPDQIESGTRLEYMPGTAFTGPITVMAKAGGYVMVRRPHGAPFVLTVREAASLKALPKPKRMRGER